MGAQEPAWTHLSVLLHEAVQAVLTRADGVYVDGTFGRGGHARALLQALSPQARVFAFDKDPRAVAAALALADPRLRPVHASFAQMREQLQAQGVSRVDGVLLDLGVSSPQLDEAERGFSFRLDAPLDMRMDTTRGETAAQYLQRVDEAELARVLRDYGEERFAARIARAIVSRRAAGQPLLRTGELARLVAQVVRTREPGQDPATRSFQALRIQVNDELQDLSAGLEAALQLLHPEGRLAVISFHSLEDRIVKSFIARESREQVDRRVPFAPSRPLRLRALARLRPSAQEVAANPRARSAILRVAQRTEAQP